MVFFATLDLGEDFFRCGRIEARMFAVEQFERRDMTDTINPVTTAISPSATLVSLTPTMPPD